VRISEDGWKSYKGTIIFNIQQNEVVCRFGDFFFCEANEKLFELVP